jgi:PII-like signaling protein
MQTYPKKRVEIFIEAPVLHRLLQFLSDQDVTGYTVLPALAGRGDSDRVWSREGQVGDAGRMVAIVMIIDEAKLDTLFDQLYAMVARQIGIIAVSDCTVVRGERF